MVITIQIQNKKDYQWLLPFLDALKNTTATVEVKGNSPAENGYLEKRKAYLQFLKLHTIPVKKVEIPSREERNAR